MLNWTELSSTQPNRMTQEKSASAPKKKKIIDLLTREWVKSCNFIKLIIDYHLLVVSNKRYSRANYRAHYIDGIERFERSTNECERLIASLVQIHM